jgi:hypothetical protein
VAAVVPAGLALALPLLAETVSSRPAPPESAPVGGLTAEERHALAASVGACWNAGALEAEARERGVTVALDLRPDGTPVAETIRLIAPGDDDAPGVAGAYEAARRAIIRCGAGGFDLPAHKYTDWRRVEMTFPAAGGMR